MEGESSRGPQPRFDKIDENYRTWATYCKAYLKNRAVWSAVVEPRPLVTPVPVRDAATAAAMATANEQTRAAAAWDRKNEVALSDIMMAVKPHLLNIVEDCVTAKEAWDNLRILFEDDTTSRRAELEQELAVLKMGGGVTIIKFVGRAQGLRNDLATAGVVVSEHSMVLHVLRGLPSGNGMIKTVLENLPTPLRLPAATAKLLNVEKQIKANDGGGAPPTGQAFTAGEKPVAPTTGKGKRKKTCFYCKRPGHFVNECRTRKADDAKRGGDGNKGHGTGGERMGFAARAPHAADGVQSLANNANVWLVDSGATHHMATGRGDYMLSKEENGAGITLASGGMAAVVGEGTATIKTNGEYRAKTITLDNTMCVPELRENLLSVATVDKVGGAVAFLGGRCYLFQEADTIRETGVLAKAGATGAMDLRGQYMLGGGGGPPEAMVASAAVAGVPVIWHRRFFHLGFNNLAKAAKIVKGLPPSEVVPERVAGAICPPCAQGKLARAPHPASTTTAPRMTLIHSDTCGPFSLSLGGALHFVTLLEDKTKLLLAVPIAAKSHTGAVLREKIPMLERLCGDKAKRIRFDGAKDYVTKEMIAWYAAAGIDYEVTPPYSSQSNGAAKRINRTIKEMVRSALADAGMGQELWAEALAAAVYVRSRSPHAGCELTPREDFTGEKSDVSGFRV